MKPPSIADVQRAVEARYGITHAQLLSPNRERTFARPRQIAMALAVDLIPRASLPAIGLAFRRDHSTVVYAVRKIAALAAADPTIADEISELRAVLSPDDAGPSEVINRRTA